MKSFLAKPADWSKNEKINKDTVVYLKKYIICNMAIDKDS